jgi:cell wall-associated NlpC family hydrolase
MKRLAAGIAAVLVVLAFVTLGALAPAPDRPGLARASVPSAYAGLIDRYGRSCPQLSPALLAAQLYQESGFNPRAVSPVGAQGIAQFMPGTWRTHGLDANGDGRADPFDPHDAIASAAAYDCELARYVDGIAGDPVELMLAAYNAGPYAVINHAGVPPYAETRGYVRAIRSKLVAFSDPEGPVLAAPTAVPAAVIAFAYKVLGTPYRWGGTGEDGRFDCSGLTKTAYAAAGVALPRTSRQQWYAGAHVPRERLQPGDLVFFAHDTGDPATIHHVGIYVGNDHMIDAPRTGAVIRFDRVTRPDFIGAVRPT